MDESSKTCRRCKVDKPADAFGVNKAEPDGRNGRCRQCLAELHAAKTAAKRAAAEAVMASGEKTCTGCKDVKQLSAFPKQRSSMDGHRAKCWDCSGAVDPDAAEKRCGKCGETKQRSSFNRSSATRDGMQGYCRDCAASAGTSNRAANPDRSRDYYLANRDEILARMRERYVEDPEYWITKGRNRKLAWKLVDLGDADRRYLLWAHPYCYLCGGPLGDDVHVDHVIPVSRGGMHCRENLRPTHATCNLRKTDKLLSELDWYTGPTDIGVAARMICA